MANALDLALSAAVSSYVSPVEASQAQSSGNLVKVARKVKETTEVSVKEAAKLSAPLPTIPIPAKGSLDGKGFILAMRSAKDRDSKIQAIAAFIGYDCRDDYGAQEVRAFLAAKREMSPIDASGPSRSEKRQAQATVKGYVAGMPNGLGRQIGNLKAREEVAKDARDAFLTEACKAKVEDCSCCKGHAMARLEEERIIEIRKDLLALQGR
jgi:hypothetical protein